MEENTNASMTEESGMEITTAENTNYDTEKQYRKQELYQINRARSKLTAAINKVKDSAATQVLQNMTSFLNKYLYIYIQVLNIME